MDLILESTAMGSQQRRLLRLLMLQRHRCEWPSTRRHPACSCLTSSGREGGGARGGGRADGGGRRRHWPGSRSASCRCGSWGGAGHSQEAQEGVRWATETEVLPAQTRCSLGMEQAVSAATMRKQRGRAGRQPHAARRAPQGSSGQGVWDSQQACIAAALPPSAKA